MSRCLNIEVMASKQSRLHTLRCFKRLLSLHPARLTIETGGVTQRG